MLLLKTYRIFFLSMCFLGACGSYNTFPKERSRDIDDPVALKALIDSGQTIEAGKYRIVDVRPKSEFEKGHIPTAINLPNGNLNGVNATPPEDKMIIVYCETGVRSKSAAKKMAASGYGTIYNWGSFSAWTLAPEK